MAIETTDTGGAEDEPENQLGSHSRSLIYVDGSVPATLCLSGDSVSYATLREAVTAWLALPQEIKKDASIITAGDDGAHYRGWDIYRLWQR